AGRRPARPDDAGDGRLGVPPAAAGRSSPRAGPSDRALGARPRARWQPRRDGVPEKTARLRSPAHAGPLPLPAFVGRPFQAAEARLNASPYTSAGTAVDTIDMRWHGYDDYARCPQGSPKRSSFSSPSFSS